MKIKYKTEEEKQTIKEGQIKAGLFLIEEQLHNDGKFLIFADKPLESDSDSEEEVKIQKEIVSLQRKQAIVSLKEKGILSQDFTDKKEKTL